MRRYHGDNDGSDDHSDGDGDEDDDDDDGCIGDSRRYDHLHHSSPLYL